MRKAVRNFLSILCCIACCPCCFPCYYCAYKRRKRRGDRPVDDTWQGPKSPADVHPLSTRKRRLTLPTAAERPKFKDDQLVLSQDQSLVFQKLPLELRRQIWKEVVGGFDIYLGIVDKRMQHCKLFGTDQDQEEHTKLQMEHKLLPLLLTCRQVYSETIPFLYSANRFRTSHIDVIPALTSSIRLSRFNSISSLALSWSLPAIYRHTIFNRLTSEATLWDRTTKILASMRGLSDLHIYLWTCTPFGTTWQWGGSSSGIYQLLDMLRRVKPKKHYCLTIDEAEVEELSEECKDAPFKLHWKEEGVL